MKNETKDLITPHLATGGIARLLSGFGPQIFLAPEDGTGGGGTETGSETAASEDDKSKEQGAEDDTKDEGDGDQGDQGDDKDQESDPDDGKSKLSDEAAALLQENMRKKSKITELTKQLEKFKDIDPDEFRQLKADKVAAEQAELEKKGEFDRVKEMMASQHEQAVTAKDAEIADLKEALSKAGETISNLTIGTQFNDSPFIADELVFTPTKARKLWGAHFAQENGQVVAYDKPASEADRTLLVDGKGNPLSFEDAIRHLVKNDPEHEQIVRNKVKPGAGSGDKTPEKAPSKTGSEGVTGIDRIRSNLGGLSFAQKK